ncbi:hypothetical protein [Amycolatopsis marina]|uniref:hypothetical protein n=1 Tax=Amycolatopsis marina TaxID=490629 RepID=UPI0015A60984|nr:hypothetical protein [Amycolatopsis marina]
MEPGDVHVLVGASAADVRLRGGFTLTEAARVVGRDRELLTPTTVTPLDDGAAAGS